MGLSKKIDHNKNQHKNVDFYLGTKVLYTIFLYKWFSLHVLITERNFKFRVKCLQLNYFFIENLKNLINVKLRVTSEIS